MILKELDPFLGTTQDEIAHRIAQDRMAYHLRRFFGKTDQVHERLNQRILQCRRAASTSGILSAPERRRLGEFLRSLHRPLVPAAPR